MKLHNCLQGVFLPSLLCQSIFTTDFSLTSLVSECPRLKRKHYLQRLRCRRLNSCQLPASLRSKCFMRCNLVCKFIWVDRLISMVEVTLRKQSCLYSESSSIFLSLCLLPSFSCYLSCSPFFFSFLFISLPFFPSLFVLMWRTLLSDALYLPHHSLTTMKFIDNRLQPLKLWHSSNYVWQIFVLVKGMQ